MRVAVTGANGHVGANVIRALIHKGHEVRVMQYHGHKALDGLDLEVVNGDLLDPESLEAFCEGMEAVIHLAAKVSIGYNSYDSLYKTNVEGTKHILQAAKGKGVKRFIHFSSIHVFDHSPVDAPLSETRARVNHSSIPYEKTKLMAEEWVLGQQAEGFEVIVLNPTAIMGPYDFKPSLSGQFLLNLYQGKIPGLVPGGYYWVDARDVAEAAVMALTKGKGGEQYILSGHYKSALGISRLLQEVTGKKITSRMLPMWLAYTGVPFMYLWSKLSRQKPLYTRQSLDILKEGSKNILNEKAKKTLGFNPRPLSVTLKDSIEWFNQNNYIKK